MSREYLVATHPDGLHIEELQDTSVGEAVLLAEQAWLFAVTILAPEPRHASVVKCHRGNFHKLTVKCRCLELTVPVRH